MNRALRASLGIASGMSAAFAVATPVAAAADTRLRGRDAQYVSAFGGALAWTEPSAQGGRYRLVISNGHRHTTIRRPTSTGLISPDVGRAPASAGGQPRFVFDACSAGGRCGLYVLDQGGANGVALAGTLRKNTRYVAPSQWEGTLVYGRIRPDEPQTGRSRTGGGLFVQRPGAKPARLSSRVPQSTDLEGNRIVYAYWSSDVTSSEIRMSDTIEGKDCRVTRATGNSFVSNPVLDGGYLYFLRRNARTGSGRVARVDLPDSGACPRAKPQVGATKLPEAAGGEEGGVDDVAVDDGTVYYSALGIFRADDPTPFTAQSRRALDGPR